MIEEEERRLLVDYESSDGKVIKPNGSTYESKNGSIRNSMAVLPYAGHRSGSIKNVRAMQ